MFGPAHFNALPTSKALRQAAVEFIVAPYEADAQLAYLIRSGAVDVVITEDSDCLPYGCRKVKLSEYFVVPFKIEPYMVQHLGA